MRSKVWCSERNRAQSASPLRTEGGYQRRKRRTCRPVQVLPLGRPLLGYASFDSPRPQLLTSGSRSRQLLKYRYFTQNPALRLKACKGLVSTVTHGTRLSRTVLDEKQTWISLVSSYVQDGFDRA